MISFWLFFSLLEIFRWSGCRCHEATFAKYIKVPKNAQRCPVLLIRLFKSRTSEKLQWVLMQNCKLDKLSCKTIRERLYPTNSTHLHVCAGSVRARLPRLPAARNPPETNGFRVLLFRYAAAPTGHTTHLSRRIPDQLPGIRGNLTHRAAGSYHSYKVRSASQLSVPIFPTGCSPG